MRKPATKSTSSNFSKSDVGAPEQNSWGQSIVRFFLIVPGFVDSAPSATLVFTTVAQSLRTSSSKANLSRCNWAKVLVQLLKPEKAEATRLPALKEWKHEWAVKEREECAGTVLMRKIAIELVDTHLQIIILNVEVDLGFDFSACASRKNR